MLCADSREAMMVSPTRTQARNDVQNRADAPEGDAAWPENGQCRSVVSDRQGLTYFLYGR
jgi:hypothetical protein